MSSFSQSNLPPYEGSLGKGLYITGGSALTNTTPPPSITQYHGLFYEHSTLSYDDLKRTEKFGDVEDLRNTPVSYAEIGASNGRQSQGGFFHPRPPSYSHDEIAETHGRPSSGFSRPSSAYSIGGKISRPSSAIRKVPSRNDSRAYSEPVSRHNVSPELLLDPDHEPMADVLFRLGSYTQNFVPVTTLAYTDCECSGDCERIPSRLAKVYSSDDEDEEEEGQDTTLEVLFRTFKQYEDKGHSSVRQKAMFTLINSYGSTQQVSEKDLSQVLNVLKKSTVQVQEATLVLMKQLAKCPANLHYFLDKNVVDFIYYKCLMTPDLSALRRQGLLLSEMMFQQLEFKDIWMEFVVSKFLPKLISMVRGQTPLDVKYAACCVFRSLAGYEEFIGYVTEEILPSVILLRNASAKFKEVYVEILTTVLSHTDCVPPDLVDSSAIPITLSIIREGPCGPQCAALHLLTSLTANDSGVAMVTGTNNLVAMVLCCMKDSHCRKVKLNAMEVLRRLSSIRKIGLCKDLMLQLSGYLLPGLEEDSLASLSQVTSNTPVPPKPRFDEERHMWQGLEKFIDILKDTVFREGKVETDELGLAVGVNLKPCVDVGQVQLRTLACVFNILHNICVWPLDKSRLGFAASRIELTSFSDDEKQRHLLSKINRGLTQTIWDKVGTVVCDLLLAYSTQFSNLSSRMPATNQTCDLSLFFETEEIELIHSMLRFLLCTSLCTCVAFPELIPKLQESPSKRKSKLKLKSSSSTNVIHENAATSVHHKLKSQSEVVRGSRSDGDRLWVNENPHLTQINPGSGSFSGTAVAKSKADLQHKEACTERRLLRKCLYEAGVFRAVCSFLKCSSSELQVLVLQILRCLVHPLEERVAPKLSFTAQGSSSKGQRPQTAVPDASRRLNMAMYNMSPEIAKLINEALVTEDQKDKKHEEEKEVKKERPQAKKKILNIPETVDGLESIHERLQDFTEATKEEKLKKEEEERKKKERPVIDRCLPIAQQCRDSVLAEIGDGLLRGMFSKSQPVKKQYVILLHDIVHHGELDVHMKLSTHGCIPKLVDFLRVHENNELLEIIGIVISRILVSSDPRLRQLFNRHGGQQLLLSMAQYTSGIIKQEVSTTLKTISKLDAPVKKRPMSAPVIRHHPKQKVPDIWDQIEERWKREDQVTNVLKKWMIEDKMCHKKK